MTGLMLVGFLIGMRHALEADHVAAVASLASQSRSWSYALTQGAVWGLGHTMTLFLFGSAVLVMDGVIPERLAQGLELAVGLMLIVLGADLLRRLRRDRIHFHSHRHADGIEHFHAHAHAGESGHDRDRHVHDHPSRFPLRALLVGLVHGMAGSAALILLTLEQARSLAEGLFYIAVFGFGSIAGMSLLSLSIALPLHYTAKRLGTVYAGLQTVVGIVTLGLGFSLSYRVGVVDGLLTGMG